ncbi:MAG TPA: pyruvate, phosphate dikinase [Acidobacteriaceae bacterium]|nr:pyruvate, phosphate dikinase [Acidobacteriaceae bacterium]
MPIASLNKNSVDKDTVYRFSADITDGEGTMKAQLGGKGAGLAEMTRLGVPVPPGFTIPTGACRHYLKHKRLPEQLERAIDTAVSWLEGRQRQTFGGVEQPLLVSVRSGAAVSMPGMMDTILNVGLTEANVEGLAAAHGSLRFALDSYRRLIQMFGSVVLQVPKVQFDQILERVKHEHKVEFDFELKEEALRTIISGFKACVLQHAGRPFPEDARAQLLMAAEAVFQSWTNTRAQHYRRMYDIPDEAGTAVTVQAMVFGNSGMDSGTGVGFTRNPITGDPAVFGEFLPNAQGEDIVAGIRTPLPLSELSKTMPGVYGQLCSITKRLEKHLHDMQDFEFTVQKGELFLLQTRTAKRSAMAALQCAVDMAHEGLISRTEALQRVKPEQIGEILSPQLDLSDVDVAPATRGLPASSGSAVGRIALTADHAVRMAGKHRETPIILVRQETVADDIHGMEASVGFLTAHGGATSHAAVVARGMGKCCITGANAVVVDDQASTVKIGNLVLREGDWLSLDGLSGQVFACKVPLRAASLHNAKLNEFLGWAQCVSVTPIRANADTPEDAERARRAGAVGIGLCRTEHMFFAPERLEWIRAMILTEDLDQRRQALNRLLPMQKADFEALFRTMDGLPVTIRLIDPPLHEFLPRLEELDDRLSRARLQSRHIGEIAAIERLRTRTRDLQETNPMMGHRGCRLGITHPEIIVMQVRAILEAAIAVQRKGVRTVPEIMVPLVAGLGEVRAIRKLVEETAQAVFAELRQSTPYKFGAMIELPRAAVCAGSIAKEVDFLSFGTNDLTQMTFGFSRDDASKYLDAYIEAGILEKDPFVTIDREGVGALMKMAIERAREANPAIKIGVCGEHAGDPESIEFLETLDLNYLSCSPARIPAARLAIAQTAIAGETHSPMLIPTEVRQETFGIAM